MQQVHVWQCVQELICDWKNPWCFYKECLHTDCPFLLIQNRAQSFFTSLAHLTTGCYFEVLFGAGSVEILGPSALGNPALSYNWSKWNVKMKLFFFPQGKYFWNCGSCSNINKMYRIGMFSIILSNKIALLWKRIFLQHIKLLWKNKYLFFPLIYNPYCVLKVSRIPQSPVYFGFKLSAVTKCYYQVLY